MGVLSGIEILFFIMGILATLSVLVMVKLNQKYNAVWYTWTIAGTGAFLLIFTLGWSVSSLLEGEIQAANMGLLVFGLPALILFGVTRRMITAVDAGKVMQKTD